MRGRVEGFHQIGRHAVFLGQVEVAGPSGQLEDVGRVIDCLKPAAAVLAFDQSGDAFPDDEVPEAFRDEVDELLATQDPHGVIGVHYRFFRAGQAETCAADDDGTKRRLVAIINPPFVRLSVGLYGLGQSLSQHFQRLGRRARLRVIVHWLSIPGGR